MRLAQSFVLFISAVSLGISANAQQPPDVVTSDSFANVAMGPGVLNGISASGATSENTGAGYFALHANTTGASNTAFGTQALYENTEGSNNTAVGASTLRYDTLGSYNSAVGEYALAENTTGYENTAVGAAALQNNMVGYGNTAVGYNALAGTASAATGNDNNTAFGAFALYSNTTGKGNAAQGVNALYFTTTGIRNLGIGSNALYTNTTGSYNIALGFNAGYNVTTGSNNIEIGASGAPSDNNTIQIGSQGTQTTTSIAGIFGTPITGSAVFVTATGQLGVQASSEAYKTDIAPMPPLAENLTQLRPVTFHYKTDPKGVRQFGLIAEEVDKVYPELVIRDNTGKIQGLHYEELAPMLLNVVQQQQAAIRTQGRKQEADAGKMRAQAQEIRALNERLTAQAGELKSVQGQVAELNDLKHELQSLLIDRKAKESLLARYQ
jgi:hypothetical protein